MKPYLPLSCYPKYAELEGESTVLLYGSLTGKNERSTAALEGCKDENKRARPEYFDISVDISTLMSVFSPLKVLLRDRRS